MDSFRLPRFQRETPIAPMQLTERDRAIIRLVYRHRFVSSPQIASFIVGSSQQLLRRLQLLYHNGYLERPRAQIDYYHHGGSRPMVYGLGEKGAVIMKQELGNAFRKIDWREKNSLIGRIFLEHTLFVSQIMIALEVACREYGVRLLTEEELQPVGHKLFRWSVKLNNGLKLNVIPDRVFALEFLNKQGQTERISYFLEADRGTMPVTRRGFSQSSFNRKLLAYEATWSQSIHQQFGFHRFQVLTVTTSQARVNSLVEACSKLKRGHGLFLFADQTILTRPADFFAATWQTGRKGETSKLLPLPSTRVPEL